MNKFNHRSPLFASPDRREIREELGPIERLRKILIRSTPPALVGDAAPAWGLQIVHVGKKPQFPNFADAIACEPVRNR
jgi:hypothetical protein